MNTIEQPTFPRPACHHEAGHCVVRWCFGAWMRHAEVFDTVGLESPGDGSETAYRTGGRIVGTNILSTTWPPVSDRVRRIAAGRGEMELVMNVAGAVAEARFRKRSFASCWLEADLDREVCERIAAATIPDGDVPLETAFRRATALLKAPAAWSAVDTIAAFLEVAASIDGDAIDHACSRAFGQRQPFPFEWDGHWPVDDDALRAGWLPPAMPGAYPSAVGRGDFDLGCTFRTGAASTASDGRRTRNERRNAG